MHDDGRRNYFLNTLLYMSVVYMSIYTLTPTETEAQLGMGVGQLLLSTSPTFPIPNADVTVRLEDYSVNAIGAEVFWFIDDVEQTEVKNERSITVRTGAVGEETVVRAILRKQDGNDVAASAVIVPTVVDLVLEANTYVPSFYKGRSLPARKSMLSAVALVHDGKTTESSTYTYRWTLGQNVLFAGPVRGKNRISFEMPLFSTDLAVEVLNESGNKVGYRSINIEAVKPELHFYEWSPLRGLYQRELSNPFALIGEETVIYGEPYFVSQTPSRENADFTWRIDGAAVLSNTDVSQAFGLTRENLGNGQVSLNLVTKDRVPAVLEKSFTVIAN